MELSERAQKAVKDLLRYSFRDIDYMYEDLTLEEQDVVDLDTFEEIKTWLEDDESPSSD